MEKKKARMKRHVASKAFPKNVEDPKGAMGLSEGFRVVPEAGPSAVPPLDFVGNPLTSLRFLKKT